jgi:hypothetical protein
MPSGLIEDQNGVSAGSDFGRDLVETKLHGFGVAGRQHEGPAGSEFGAHRTEHIGRLRALIVDRPGTRAFSGPAVGMLALLVITACCAPGLLVLYVRRGRCRRRISCRAARKIPLA